MNFHRKVVLFRRVRYRPRPWKWYHPDPQITFLINLRSRHPSFWPISFQFFTNINSVTAWKIFLTRRIKKRKPHFEGFPLNFWFFGPQRGIFEEIPKSLLYYGRGKRLRKLKSICDFFAMFYIYNDKYVFRILFSILLFEILLSSRACFESAPTTPH